MKNFNWDVESQEQIKWHFKIEVVILENIYTA